MPKVSKNKVLYEQEHVNVKVDYFWDNHGDLVNWNKFTDLPTSWKDAKVKLEKKQLTQTLFNKEYTFEVTQLTINDNVISGDVLNCIIEKGFDGSDTFICRITVGWG